MHLVTPMIRFITLIYFTVFLFEVRAQEREIKVGLFRASVIKEISIELNEGSQLCLQSNLNIWGTKNHPIFQLSAKDNKIEVYQNAQFLGLFKQIICQSGSGFSVNLKPIKPQLKGNKYSGKITISAENGFLKMINKIQEADYLSGVLRGEVGYDKSNSLYEVHAILSRTYARFYKDRHRSEGFELCDQTHCQVFKGFNDYKPYHQSIQATKNTVVLDSLNGELAELLFHSNCGGQTNASEDVWKTTLTYCRSVYDTFCLKSQQAIWVKQFPLDVFCTKINVSLPSDSISKNSLCDAICSFSRNRPNEIYIGNKKFKMTDLRTQLNVKSAWFDWECNGETVYLSGKGFGHGVGMCQEGAIRMSELGFSPSQIIKHYYRNVIISKIP
jgi:stage II sporulation protein D